MKQDRCRGSTLDYLTLSPDGHGEGASIPLIICLHGYGADTHDLTGLASAISPCDYRYVFPNGPLPAFDGADSTLRAWYERGGNESPGAVRDALAALHGLVEEVQRRYAVPPGRMLLLGFSQGGAMALRYGLPLPEQFAGLAVLSGSLRRVEDLHSGLPARRDQLIFVAHGMYDDLIPVEWSRQVADFLQGQGYRPTYRTYWIGHQISPAELTDVRNWIRTTLPATRPPA